jgi:hypothetical protein
MITWESMRSPYMPSKIWHQVGYHPNWVRILKETHPFRQREFLDELI